VTDESGMREYVREGNGVLCDRDDVDDVEAKLRQCLQNTDQLTRNAQRVADSYDICQTIGQLGDLYRAVAADGS